MKTIATFWTGPRLRDFEHLCVRSWVAMGHPVKFFCYEDVANVPPGVEICDANRVLEQRVIYEDAPELARKPFTQANLFRLAMLMKGEGVWCDVDYAMIRPLPEFTEILLGAEQNGKLCNAILWLPPEHEMMPTVLKHFLGRTLPPWTYAKPRWKKFWKTLLGAEFTLHDFPKSQWGRHALEYYVRKGRLEDQVKNYKAFYYPVIYDDYLYKPNPYDHIVNDPEVHGLHVFYKKRSAYLAAGTGSFVGWLKQTYGDTLEADPELGETTALPHV